MTGPGRATNASVASVDVEIDRPADRARKRDVLRSDDNTTESISGSGSNETTFATNNSEGKWFLDKVTAFAPGAGDTLTTIIRVKDGNDNTVYGLAGSGVIDFDGTVIKNGWDVTYEIKQGDANNYTVQIWPLIRKPNPGESTADTDTETFTVYEDFERTSPLNDYSGDTGEFGTVTSNVYQNNTALAYNGSGTGKNSVVSTSGLANYPSDPFVMRGYLRMNQRDVSEDFMGIMFGASDNLNGWILGIASDNDFELNEYVSGSTTRTAFTEEAAPTDTGSWWAVEMDFDSSRTPSFEGTLIDPNGDRVDTITDDISLKGDGIGVYGNRNSTGTEYSYDYIREV